MTDLSLLAQLIVNGLLVGGIYALIAVGLTLIYGVLGVVNFAHGEFYMLGAYVVLILFRWFSYPVAILLTIIVMAALSLPIERAVIRPMLSQSFESAVIATLALSMIMVNAVQAIFSATPYRLSAGLQTSFTVYNLTLPGQRLIIFLLAILSFTCLHFFLVKTKLGKTIRAVSQNREGAIIAGIKVGRVSQITFLVGISLAALSGSLVSPLFGVFPTMGQPFVLEAFAIVIIGGLGDARGALLASLALGVSESLVGGLVSGTYANALGFVLMLLVLAFRPNGIFGRAVRTL